jgi:hypothetical protein
VAAAQLAGFGYTCLRVEARSANTEEIGAVRWRSGADGSVPRTAWRTSAARYWHNRPAAGRGGTGEDDAYDPSTELEQREPPFGMP